MDRLLSHGVNPQTLYDALDVYTYFDRFAAVSAPFPWRLATLGRANTEI